MSQHIQHDVLIIGSGVAGLTLALTLPPSLSVAVLSKGEQRLVMRPGESACIGANESPVNISGAGRLARVYNKL